MEHNRSLLVRKSATSVGSVSTSCVHSGELKRARALELLRGKLELLELLCIDSCAERDHLLWTVGAVDWHTVGVPRHQICHRREAGSAPYE